MTLGLTTNSNFLPIIVYDARAGRLFKVDRILSSNGWEAKRLDITNPAPVFAVDFGSIEVGYVLYTNAGPDFKVVPLGQPLPMIPSKEYKQCCRVRIASQVLGGVREFSSSAKCVLNALDDLHNKYEAASEAAEGKIPIVKLGGTNAVPTNGPQGKTTTYAPVFEIIGWTERFPELGEATVAPPRSRHTSNEDPSSNQPPTVPPAMPF
jgi:hypothetical protein